MKFLAPRCHIMKPFQFKNKINTTVGMEWNHMFSGRDCVFNSVVATVDTNYGSANLISRLLHHNVHFDIKIGQNDIDMITKSNN